MKRAMLFVMLMCGVAVADPAKDKTEAAHRVFDVELARWKAGSESIEHVCDWSVRWMEADGAADAIGFHAKRIDDIAAEAKKRVAAGIGPSSEVDIAAYYQADVALRKAKKK